MQAVEEVAPEKVSPTLCQASEMQGGGAQAPCTDSADSAEAAAKAAGRVRKGGPFNEVRHNLFGALEMAHKSVCDVSQQRLRASCAHVLGTADMA